MRITKRAVARVAIAVTLGGAVATITDFIEQTQLNWRLPLTDKYIITDGFLQHTTLQMLLNSIILIMPPAILACLVAISAYVMILKPNTDGECRCRKCGYILKGITEPKCSECGEPI